MRKLILLTLLFTLPLFAAPQWPATDGETAFAVYDLPTTSSTPNDVPTAVDAATGTCAGWGLGAPVGAWSCTVTTITRTASASDPAVTNIAVVAGQQYRVDWNPTITAGSFTISLGGVSGTTQTTSGAKTEYITASTTGAVTITASATGAGTIPTTITVKPVQGVVIPSWADRVIMSVEGGAVRLLYNKTPTSSLGVKIADGEKWVFNHDEMMLFRAVQWYGLAAGSKVVLQYSRGTKE